MQRNWRRRKRQPRKLRPERFPRTPRAKLPLAWPPRLGSRLRRLGMRRRIRSPTRDHPSRPIGSRTCRRSRLRASPTRTRRHARRRSRPSRGRDLPLRRCARRRRQSPLPVHPCTLQQPPEPEPTPPRDNPRCSRTQPSRNRRRTATRSNHTRSSPWVGEASTNSALRLTAALIGVAPGWSIGRFRRAPPLRHACRMVPATPVVPEN